MAERALPDFLPMAPYVLTLKTGGATCAPATGPQSTTRRTRTPCVIFLASCASILFSSLPMVRLARVNPRPRRENRLWAKVQHRIGHDFRRLDSRSLLVYLITCKEYLQHNRTAFIIWPSPGCQRLSANLGEDKQLEPGRGLRFRQPP